MKRIYQYILAASLLGSTAMLHSCDDEDNIINEWNMTYVSLQQTDYLRPIPTFNLTHEIGEKIKGEVSVSIVATIQKPTTHDIKVGYSAICEGISPEKIQKTAEVAHIKAGSTKSDPITISISDWSDLENIKEAASYSLNIKITDISSDSKEVTGSNFYQDLSVKINKSTAKPVKYLIFGETPKTGTLHTNVKDWEFKFMEGVENAGSNSVAGTGYGDVATNGKPFWITINFKSPKKITGIKTTHWANAFAPTKVELYTSDNGVKWEPLGDVATSRETQIISFKKPKTAQYLKYQMIKVPSRVDITALHVYLED